MIFNPQMSTLTQKGSLPFGLGAFFIKLVQFSYRNLRIVRDFNI